MNILHVITSLGRGGAEKLVSVLLPKMKKKGCKVRLVSLADKLAFAPELKASGIEVDCLHFKGTIYEIGKVAQACLRLRKIIEAEMPDIVHSHIYMADLLVRASAPRGTRLVSTLHGSDAWWSEKKIRAVLKTYLDSYSGRLRGARYLAVSEAVKEMALRSLHLPLERTRTILNGINIDNFKLIASPRKADQPTVLQVGRFYREKGHEFSLQAFLILKEKIPGVQLILVGDGPLRSEMEQFAVELRISDSVRFLGERDDIPDLLSMADIFWMPSLHEGLPIAALEAMATGLPIVASSVGGLKELVTDSENGLLVQPRDAGALAESTIKLLANKELRERIGANARQMVDSKYSISKTADDYIKAYEDLLSGRW